MQTLPPTAVGAGHGMMLSLACGGSKVSVGTAQRIRDTIIPHNRWILCVPQ